MAVCGEEILSWLIIHTEHMKTHSKVWLHFFTEDLIDLGSCVRVAETLLSINTQFENKTVVLISSELNISLVFQ